MAGTILRVKKPPSLYKRVMLVIIPGGSSKYLTAQASKF